MIHERVCKPRYYHLGIFDTAEWQVSFPLISYYMEGERFFQLDLKPFVEPFVLSVLFCMDSKSLLRIQDGISLATNNCLNISLSRCTKVLLNIPSAFAFFAFKCICSLNVSSLSVITPIPFSEVTVLSFISSIL